MCVGGNDAPPPKEVEKPVFIHNPYLDEDKSKDSGGPGRVSRAALAIPLETGIGFEGRGGSTGATDPGNPLGNARPSSANRSDPTLPVIPAPRTVRPTPVGPFVPGDIVRGQGINRAIESYLEIKRREQERAAKLPPSS